MLVALALLAGACGDMGANLNAEARDVPFQKGEFGGVAFVDKDWVVLSYNDDPNAVGSATSLWRLKIDGTRFEQLSVDSDVSCDRVAHLAPSRLGDGRIGFVLHCSHLEGPDPIERILMALDLETGNTERLVESSLDTGTGVFTWDPAVSRGLYGETSAPCVGIVGLTRAGVEYLPITIEDDGQSWRLDEQFLRPLRSQCRDVGRASWPAWSPDGKLVAFFASPAAIGKDGLARLDAPWNLYFMDSGLRMPTKVLENVLHPQELKWSPDGRLLAFGGEIDGQEGIWTYRSENGTLERLSEEGIHSLDWAPDGTRIIGIRTGPSDAWPPEDSLVLYGVSR
jgi:hypothetical protein